MRKIVTALAVSAAAIATVGMGTASADVAEPAKNLGTDTAQVHVQGEQVVVGKYPTLEVCDFMGMQYMAFAGVTDYSCRSSDGGSYVLRVTK